MGQKIKSGLAMKVNMVTGGSEATIPMVVSVGRVQPVAYMARPWSRCRRVR